MCWPDGDFTHDEQRTLGTMTDMVVASVHTDRKAWLALLGRLLSICMGRMSHRRLAHLLSVPLRPSGWPSAMTLPYCFAVRHGGEECVKGDVDVCQLLLQLPLCPNVGSLKVGWRKHMAAGRHCHPGRSLHDEVYREQTLSLVHGRKSKFSWFLTALGAYPVCGCQFCKFSRCDFESPAVIQHWHRWRARPAKRAWMSMSVLSVLG